MDSNRKSPLRIKAGLMALFIFVAAYLIVKGADIYLILVFAGLSVFQFFQITKSLDAAVPPSQPVSEDVQFDEVAQTFRSSGNPDAAGKMTHHLNDALQKIRRSRREQDSDLQFFKNVVQHIGIGLIAFKRDGTIQIINSAAKRLLRVTRATNIQELREFSDPLVEAFLKLKTGGRELVHLKYGDESFQLSIFAIELTLRGEELKLMSMTNIQTELEEKEMEAWQNLVRVLTHEIMNSVTPISSLAEMAEQEIGQHLKTSLSTPLRKDQLEDMHLSLQTISKRSEGLIRFVKEFRNLTHIPKPKLSDVPVKPLLEEMTVLHKKELADKGISISVEVNPVQLTITADKHMIEQVLINLIKNAIQAFDEQPEKKILLRGFAGDKGRPVVSVQDNGTGIDPEALEKIFIPFFSTKKTGSGIGLSLSKQIMRQHEGRITVKSIVGEGTEFLLRF